MTVRTSQTQLDRANKAFWNELCGTNMARAAGISDDSAPSLKKFDDWFFRFYPYLFGYLPFAEMRGKRVLEVGLGYGSVSQKLAEAGTVFHGLDIAAGPVALARHRLALIGSDGDVREGSVLSAPFGDAMFDWIVSIGCLHHTGDMRAAIGEIYRMLKPGGDALIMVYSASSYRQWALNPSRTCRRVWGFQNSGEDDPSDSKALRGMYDRNSLGDIAPQTEFTTKRELRGMCKVFHSCTITSENIGADGPFRFVPRSAICRIFGPWLGLDLYCRVRK